MPLDYARDTFMISRDLDFKELFLKLEWKEPSNVVLIADGETSHSGFLGASLIHHIFRHFILRYLYWLWGWGV